jgi:hypothetical protein
MLQSPNMVAPSVRPYKIRFEERPGYLFAHVKAETIDRNTAFAYLQDLGAKCAELNAKRLLVIRDIPMVMSDVKNYQCLTEMIRVLGRIRLALVNPYSEFASAVDFGTLVIRSKRYDYKAFTSMDDAEQWLLEDETEESESFAAYEQKADSAHDRPIN